MTGAVVYANVRGFGGIRAPGIYDRIAFSREDLSGVAFADVLGRQVDFDLTATAAGQRAVRVRPAGTFGPRRVKPRTGAGRRSLAADATAQV
jgi:hypothetical protein